MEAFPDIRIIFEDIIIEGNKVVCRYYLTGTQHTKVILNIFSQQENSSR
jgi:predicted ester cyclase